MHEYDTLLLGLFAIFVAAKAVGEIFERLRLPAVLGEIAEWRGRWIQSVSFRKRIGNAYNFAILQQYF